MVLFAAHSHNRPHCPRSHVFTLYHFHLIIKYPYGYYSKSVRLPVRYASCTSADNKSVHTEMPRVPKASSRSAGTSSRTSPPTRPKSSSNAISELEKYVKEYGREDIKTHMYQEDSLNFGSNVVSKMRYLREKGVGWQTVNKYIQTDAELSAHAKILRAQRQKDRDSISRLKKAEIQRHAKRVSNADQRRKRADRQFANRDSGTSTW